MIKNTLNKIFYFFILIILTHCSGQFVTPHAGNKYTFYEYIPPKKDKIGFDWYNSKEYKYILDNDVYKKN